MGEPSAQVSPLRGFVSYTHLDNEAFGGVVERVARDLNAIYSAKSGTELDLFVDRQSIGWGEDWRAAIRASVEQATFFIPIVTQRYFQSKHCCEELQAYYQSADVLGVTDLLLPIILMGASAIREDDPREEVRIVERLQYMSIEDAWMAGFDSAEWRRAMVGIANALFAAFERVEGHLIASPSDVTPTPSTYSGAPGLSETQVVPAAEADLGGLLETAEALQAKLQAALLASHRFTSTATSALAGDLGSLPPSVMRSRLLVAANRMGQPSVELQQTTAEAYREVSRFDALLRAMQADLAETSVADDVAESMSQISSTVDFDSTLKGLREVSQLMRAFSGLSVPLRKSLAPAVNGVNALVKTLETVRSWASLPGRTRPEGT
jgi:hypothetical protein